MASRLLTLLCCDAFRSSDALPKEKARRSRDFPGRLGSFLRSVRRRAATLSGLPLLWGGPGVDSGGGGSDDTGWDNGDGLAVRFGSSALGVALLDDDDAVSGWPVSGTDELDELAEGVLPVTSR